MKQIDDGTAKQVSDLTLDNSSSFSEKVKLLDNDASDGLNIKENVGEEVNDGTRDFLDWLEEDDNEMDEEDGNEEEEEKDDSEEEEEEEGDNDDDEDCEEENSVDEKDHNKTYHNDENDTKNIEEEEPIAAQDGSDLNRSNFDSDNDKQATKNKNSHQNHQKSKILDRSERKAIQIGATTLLCRLCTISKNITSTTNNGISEEGNVLAVLHSIRTFARRDARLIVRIIIKSFSVKNNNNPIDKNATIAMVALMREYTANQTIQEEGCAVFCNLFSVPMYCKFIAHHAYDASIISVILEALDACGMHNVKVANAALTATSNLCRPSSSTESNNILRKSILSSGAKQVIQNVIDSHTNVPLIQKRGMKLLSTLSPTPQEQQEIKEEEEANKLNACYEALEKMRKLNLEVELRTSDIDFKRCTQCLRHDHNQQLQQKIEQQQHQNQHGRLNKHVSINALFSSIILAGPSRKQKHMSKDNNDKHSCSDTDGEKTATPTNDNNKTNDNHLNHHLHHPTNPKHITDTTTTTSNKNTSQKSKGLNGPNQKIKQIISDTRIKTKTTMTKTRPCLICGSPSCINHSCPSFLQKKDDNGGGLVICNQCAPLFTLDFIIDCVSYHYDNDDDDSSDSDNQQKQKQQKIDQMIDAYDRALLILKYSSKYLIHDISNVLKKNTKRNNKVGLGSSATGVVSGITGVAAAAAIFTPAGPPLLIASLLFGGSATAASMSSDAVNYYSEANKVADKIIALQTMVHSILRVSGVLRDALLRNHIRLEDYLDDANADCKGGSKKNELREIRETLEQIQTTIQKESIQIPLKASKSTVTYAVAGAEIGILASRNARFVSRATTNVMRTARFARFAGGALSAATIVMDANEMKKSVLKIKEGNVCEKADLLIKIKEEVDEFPETNVLSGACDKYLEIMSMQRQNRRRKEQSEGKGGCADEVVVTHQGID